MVILVVICEKIFLNMCISIIYKTIFLLYRGLICNSMDILCISMDTVILLKYIKLFYTKVLKYLKNECTFFNVFKDNI